jgi:hypothetical protein
MTRKILAASAFLLVLGLAFGSSAQAQQRLNIQLGNFWVRGEDGRPGATAFNPPTNTDVLIADLRDPIAPLGFQVKDFNGVTGGAEWLMGIGNYLDIGAGIGIYSRTVATSYAFLVNTDQSEITQSLKLRIVPVTATIRFLPLGHDAVVQPYIGAGLGIFMWRYSESGNFVASDLSTFQATYVGSGTNVGPVVVAGATIPLGRTFGIGAEVRYQRATGKLTTYIQDPNNGFLGDRIDLGGMTVQANFQIKFGRR